MEPSQQNRQRSSPPTPVQSQHPNLPPLHPLPQPQPHAHSSQPQLFAHIPSSSSLPLKTTHNTPASSPGLFSPTATRMAAHQTSLSESSSPAPDLTAPYLHPLQYKVRETHKAHLDSDNITGRKLINQYEVIEEIGRGMHGKVKLARNLHTGENVAIKIIPRFSKKRRLGKVTAMSPQDKTKKEIAILKKIRHPNVVALLEVIDDPELKKIYMVLEHAELGEVVWRKKGLPHICYYERRRIEHEMSGETRSTEEEDWAQLIERRQALKEFKRARMVSNYPGSTEYWSLEHGPADESGSSVGQQSRIPSKDDFAIMDGPSSGPGSGPASRVPSRSQSIASVAEEYDDAIDWSDDMETPGPLRSNPNSTTGLDGTMYGAYMEEGAFRVRSPSMADSIISHMSSIDFNPQTHDTFADDFSYVPCFTLDQARSTFRDTLLGLEYLHYQGVVHRDIKPANLLWSKNHQVKISDFGVSYFGRPIRDGEMDETVSESEARDFDDDLELAKTVGTPAFFAPELCYTDVNQEQPKVSEQIDVWSLGVTLYCLIYARIPFLAEDEFRMFKKIATEDVYIPRRRLKPVDPSTSPSTTSLYKRHNSYPYRNDNDLEYEEVDGLLYDLLRLMLHKDPAKRINIRDIKRHPWVIQGLQNPIGWLDDTDPGRPSSGRRIQVDEREMSHAVVPITFFQRARSVVKKAVGKVMHPLVDRSDSKSRPRATSSVASSAGDSMANAPPTSYLGDRRRSLLPDDYFASAAWEALSRERAGQTDGLVYDPLATVIPPEDSTREPSRAHSEVESSEGGSRSGKRSLNNTEMLGRRLSQQLSKRTSALFESYTTPTTPAGEFHPDDQGEYLLDGLRKPREYEMNEDMSRSRSVDRGFFTNGDKRAAAQVALNVAAAPGSIQAPTTPTSRRPRPMRSVDLGKTKRHSLTSPLAPRGTLAADGSAPAQFHPVLGLPGSLHTAPEQRPQTAHYLEGIPDAKSPLPRTYNNSTPETFAKAKEALIRRQQLELRQPSPASSHLMDPVNIPCPPSPDDEEWEKHRGAPSRGDTMTTVKSSSTDSMEAIGTPLTCPSEVTSPISCHAPTTNVSDRMLVFRSDPSLPALLSESSSVSADMEAELLNLPGVVSSNPALLETTDSLTPPALTKEPDGGFPLDQVFGNAPAMESGHFRLHVSSDADNAYSTQGPPLKSNSDDGEDDDDDGSDDGIIMMSSSKRKSFPATNTVRRAPFEARRRDTNISTTSTETAKPISYGSDGARSPNAF